MKTLLKRSLCNDFRPAANDNRFNLKLKMIFTDLSGGQKWMMGLCETTAINWKYPVIDTHNFDVYCTNAQPSTVHRSSIELLIELSVESLCVHSFLILLSVVCLLLSFVCDFLVFYFLSSESDIDFTQALTILSSYLFNKPFMFFFRFCSWRFCACVLGIVQQ